MKIDKIKIFLKDGSTYTIDSEENIKEIINSFPKNLTYKKESNIVTLHNKYFAMVETLRRLFGKDYTKSEYPNSIKHEVFTPLKDMTHLFSTNTFEYSTKNLTSEGYSYLIDSLKMFALNYYGYILD